MVCTDANGGDCVRPIDEYAEGITLGFPARGFVSGIEAVMDAYLARKDSDKDGDWYTDERCSGMDGCIAEKSKRTGHTERHGETPALVGVGIGRQE
jgi:hypothetical protein